MSGTVGAVLVMFFSLTPLYEQGLSTFFALASFGILGALLYLLGIYPKIEAFGGLGAMLPFAGLAAACAGMTYDVGKATGSGARGAQTVFVDLLAKVVLMGALLSCAVGFVVFLTNFGTAFAAPYAPGGVVVSEVGPPYGSAEGPSMGVPVGIDPLALVWAFAAAALVCALAQLLLMLTKLPVFKFIVILFLVSALLTPFGIMYEATSLAGGGLQVLVFGAGEALVSTFVTLLGGRALPFILILCLFAFLYLLGVGTGLLKLSLDRGRSKAEASIVGDWDDED